VEAIKNAHTNGPGKSKSEFAEKKCPCIYSEAGRKTELATNGCATSG
jgi:hypothetical protein